MAYHHGGLPDALRSATAELVAERGPTGFSLREVARRAGVSHAAPQHHFGSARGLLTSVAAEGFRRLRDGFVEAIAEGGTAADLLERTGLVYVRTALAYPGHFGLMLQHDLVDLDDPELNEVSTETFGLLVTVVEAVRDQCNPALDVDDAAIMCWSLMHGLVVLTPKHVEMAERDLTPRPEIEQRVRAFVRYLIDGFAAREDGTC